MHRTITFGPASRARERMKLLDKVARLDDDNTFAFVIFALAAYDEDGLHALDELFHKSSKLEIVVLIPHYRFQLAYSAINRISKEKCDWLKLADTIHDLAMVLEKRVAYGMKWPHALKRRVSMTKQSCSTKTRSAFAKQFGKLNPTTNYFHPHSPQRHTSN